MKISKWVEVGGLNCYVMKNALWTLRRVPQSENVYCLDLMEMDGGLSAPFFITANSLEDAQKQAESICLNWHSHIHLESNLSLSDFLTSPEILWFVYELYLVEQARSDFYAFLKAYKERAEGKEKKEKPDLIVFSSFTEFFEQALSERESELYKRLGRVIFNFF